MDDRLFVACPNDNTIHVIDTHSLQAIERLSTTLTPLAPEGSHAGREASRRTVVLGPYVKCGLVDSTLYSTRSMVRSMELLLGLPYDEPVRRP